MQKKRYQKKKQLKGKNKFAKAVMSVVNKKAEQKQYTTFAGAQNYANQTDFTTWNITKGLGQGTNSSQRVGDNIFMKQLRLSLTARNYQSNTLAVCPHTTNLRVLVFRGKYDYSLTSYPASEVFELNAGSSASADLLNARIDTNQVSPLLDRIIELPANQTGGVQYIQKQMMRLLRINKTFKYRDDDDNGKTSNLYIGIVPSVIPQGQIHTVFNASFTYTDV